MMIYCIFKTAYVEFVRRSEKKIYRIMSSIRFVNIKYRIHISLFNDLFVTFLSVKEQIKIY